MMGSTIVEDEAAERLKGEYVRLKSEIRVNDERIEAARRQNADHLKTLNELLQRRGALADQMRLFAEQFAHVYAEGRDDSVAEEMRCLRKLCQTSTDHIRSLTSAITHLEDGPTRSPWPLSRHHFIERYAHPKDEKAEQEEEEEEARAAEGAGVNAVATASIVDFIPPGGDEAHARNDKRVTNHPRHHQPQLRPQVEFKQLLGRLGSHGHGGNGQIESRPTCQLRHATGELVAEKRRSGANEGRKMKLTYPEASPKIGNAASSKSTVLQFVYALVLTAAVVSSVPFLCADTSWYLRLNKVIRHSSRDTPPKPAPLSLMRRVLYVWGVVKRIFVFGSKENRKLK